MKPAWSSNQEQNRRCRILQEKILEIFNLGLPLSSATIHYLESTFGISDIRGLREILEQGDHADTETLMELLLFPDTEQRLQLEPVLQEHRYQVDDLPLIAAGIVQKNPEVQLWHQGLKLNIRLSPETTRQYVARLGIHKHLDNNTHQIICTTCSKPNRQKILVRLRAAPVTLQECAVSFFQQFLTRYGQTQRFWEYFDLVLGLLQEFDPVVDFSRQLEEKRDFLEQALKRAEQLERDLRTQAVETLHMQRINILDLDREKLILEIEMVEDLLRTLYSARFTPSVSQ